MCICMWWVGGWVGGRACVHALQSDRLVVWVLLLLQQQPSTSHYRCSPAVIAFADQVLEQHIVKVCSSGQKTTNAE